MIVIYYGDGSTFDGDPRSADPLNVQAIAQDGKNGWHVVSHADYYIYTEEMGFVGVDSVGFWDYMFRIVPVRIVLFGRTIPSDKFNPIFQEALAYADKKRRENQA